MRISEACVTTKTGRHAVGLHIGALAEDAPLIFRDLLSELAVLIADGVYPPGSPEIHPLADGPAVLQRLESRLTQGKHALDPWS